MALNDIGLFVHKAHAKIGRAFELIGFRLQYILYLGQPSFSRHILRRKQRWMAQDRPLHLQHTANKEKGHIFARLHDIPIPETYAILKTINDLPEISELAPAFVLKPTASYMSRNVFLVKNAHDLWTGEPLTRSDIIRHVGKENSSRFIIEELLIDQNGRKGAPLDYKFFCFGEKVVLLQVNERNSIRDTRKNRTWFLDPSFTPLKMRIRENLRQEFGYPPKPDNYLEMVEMVARIGKLTNAFLRIDVYATARGTVFGEFTPFPYGGLGFTRRADVFLGRHWVGEDGC